MKVLLKQDVDNLGYAGEIMNVADGYGRNYLIPKGLAVIATAGVLKQASVWRDRAAVRMAELQQEHQALAARIEETQLDFTARAGETGKLYGSITSNDIAELLNETLGTEIDKRNVTGGPLRSLGEHRVPVRLSRDYNPRVSVIVAPFVEEPELEEVPESEEGMEVDGELATEEVSESVEELAAEVDAALSEESPSEEEADLAEDSVSDEEADSAEDLASDVETDPAEDTTTVEDVVDEEPDAEEPAAEADTTIEDAA